MKRCQNQPEDTAPPNRATDLDQADESGLVVIEDGEDQESAKPGGGEEELSEGPQQRRFVIRRELKMRLDVYLQKNLKGISRSRVQKLIDLGGVTVNGKGPKASTTVHAGDQVDVLLPAPAIRTIVPEAIPLNILYEDDAFLIINKQSNLIVHPARSHLTGTLVNGLAHYFKGQAEQAGESWSKWSTRGFRKAGQFSGKVKGLSEVGSEDLRPGIVHRLDKNTTGVMVVAKNDEAHWLIARQFENREPVKAYLAVVHGNIEDAAGVIDQPIGKHPTIREAYSVRHDSSGRHSVTIYRVRERYKGYCLVELELKTGRTHQIRVHLSYLGHPIVGDLVYGGEPVGDWELDNPPVAAGSRKFLPYARDKEEGLKMEAQALLREDLVMCHPALHAAFLRFTHPLIGKTVTYRAPLHEKMAVLVRELRKRRIEGLAAKSGWWVELNEAIV